MSTTIVPASRPKLNYDQANTLLQPFNLAEYPVRLLGIRGYYKQTMGNPVTNDIGIYDDAIIIVSADGFMTYNANTDPSIARDGVATLLAGQAYLYKIGQHGVSGPKPYKALRQHGRVTVTRYNRKGTFTDTADAPYYIDIHRGSLTKTSSLGCQTIYPTQWPGFIAMVEDLMKRNGQEIIPYALVEM